MNSHIKTTRKGHLSLLIYAIFLFFFSYTFASASTYYVSSTTGDDTCNGLSSSPYTAGSANCPWKTIHKVNSPWPGTLIPGDSVLFKKGDIWLNEEHLVPHSGNTTNKFIYDSYGTGVKPIIQFKPSISGWNTQASWTQDGNNWYTSFSIIPYRLWISGIEVKRNKDISTSSSYPYYWDSASNRLYVYSVTNPATTFTNMEWEGGDYPIYAVSAEHDVILRNLDIRGGSTTIAMKGCDNWIIENNNIGFGSGGNGIHAFALTGIHETSNNNIVRNNIFDTGSSGYWGWEAKHTEDGIRLYYGSHGWEIYGNTIKNWGHTGIYLVNLDSNYTVSNNSVHDNYITAPDIDYGRAFGADGIVGTMSGNDVYNNTFYDLPTQIQIDSEGLKFHHNIINKVRDVVWRPGVGNGLALEGYSNTVPQNMEIYNNVIANCDDDGIKFGWGGVERKGNIFRNNIVYNCGNAYPFTINIQNDAANMNNTWQNNLVYRTGGTDLFHFKTANYSASNFNLLNGTEGNVISNNIQGDPFFVDAANGDFHLQSTSPAIDTGINIIGLSYNGAATDIGAYESNYTSDTTAPTISSFTIPTTSTTLSVPISTFTATDTTGVTGYLLTETSTTPSAASGSWSSTIPTTYTFSTEGSKTLYAWAKDLAGNVSTSVSDTVVITLPARTTPTTFYISNTGSDSNNGTTTSTPWQTIAKVNASTFIPGDQILFKKGDTFYGSITVSQSGTVGNPITFSSYGTGAQPIITGFTTISGWTNEGGGIYSKVITSESQTNMVTIDGVNTAMGRYPNADAANGGYLTYESADTNVSITDNQLTGTPNWTGAEAVIRKNDWTLNRTIVTNQTGGTLIYTSLIGTQNATSGYGYFIQNDLRTLDTLGEWYHNTSTGKFYMYFGGVDPSTKVVKVATLNNIIYNAKWQGTYITFDGLSIIGSIGDAISLPNWYTTFNIIQNCNISFSGQLAIYIQAGNILIDKNSISNTGSGGIYVNRDNAVITNNIIKNIGMIKGQDKSFGNNGINVGGANNSLVQYNIIENIGYDGIAIGSNNSVVKNNYINNTILVLNDGGGIYTGGNHSGLLIDSNIILNSIGNLEGRSGNTYLAEGIYLDEFASGITVQNNTIYNSSNSGIKLHKASNNNIINNVSFNNKKGIDFFNSLTNGSMTGNSLSGNIFFAKTASQLALNFVSLYKDNYSFGTSNNNYFVRPIDDNIVFSTYEPGATIFSETLAQWQTLTSQDLNSHKSPISITDLNDLQFEYNATTSNRVVTLSTPMIDVTGTKYTGSVTLLPYTSIVLIKDPNPVVVITPPSSGGGGGGGSSSSTTTTTTTTISAKAKSKDIKQDGSINIFDFNIMMANWNKTYTPSISLSKGDMTGDGVINIFDINQLMIYWGVGY